MKVSYRTKQGNIFLILVYTVFILSGILCLFSTKAHADQLYTYKYQKVTAKNSGFYYIANKASSSKAVSDFVMTKKKSAKVSPVLTVTIKKGKKVCVYLKKGTYYIRQSIGEYETGKVFNNKVKVSAAGASASTISQDKSFSIMGATGGATIYLKLKAPKTGVISVGRKGYNSADQEPSITLCNSKKKAVSGTRTIYNSWKPDGVNLFAVTKGTTYYLKIKMTKNASSTYSSYPLSYSYMPNELKKGGASKQKAVELTRSNKQTTFWMAGFNGAETQWFVYNGTGGVLSWDYEELSWLNAGKKDGVTVTAYDKSGKKLPLTYEWRNAGYTVGSGEEEGPVYFKVSVKKNCPVRYSLSIY